MNINTSIKILLVSISAIILFHIAVIATIIPYNIAWGGRLKNDTEMYIFEVISIFINLLLVFVLLMKGDYIKFKFQNKTINILLWGFLILFVLNTVGNFFAKTDFEKLFAILTFFFATLIWTILRVKHNDTTQKVVMK